MGFGFVFVGYLLCLNTVLPVYTMPVTALVAALGLRKLRVWNAAFKRAFAIGFAVAALGVAAAVVRNLPVPDTLIAVLFSALWLSVCLWQFFLFSGIYSLASEVGLPRLRARALFAEVIATFYWFLYAFLELDTGETLAPIVARFLLPMIVVGLVVAIVGLVVLFNCYTDIGMPDEKDKPEKPGLFSRLNRKNGGKQS